MNVGNGLTVLLVAVSCSLRTGADAAPPDGRPAEGSSPITSECTPADEHERSDHSGDRIVVAAGRNGEDGLFVDSDDKEGWQRLTSGSQDLVPRWSPDGGRIAFLTSRASEPADAEPPDLAFHWYLDTIRPDGTDRTRVTSVPVSLSYQWSPDGKQFVFASSYRDERNRGIDGIVSSAIYVVDIDGDNLHRLTEVTRMAHSPAWSPDGQSIAWVEKRHDSSVLIVGDADGTGRQSLTRENVIDSSPVWSPDGKRIAVLVRDQQESVELRFLTLNRKTAFDVPVPMLSKGGATGRPIEWTGAGFLLLATDTGSVIADMWGEIPTVRLARPAGRMLDPQLTGSGTGIYYRSPRNGRMHLLRSSTDGREQVDLTRSLRDVSSFDVLPAASKRVQCMQVHTGRVRDVAISPYGKWFWQQQQLDGHDTDYRINAVAMTRDGARAVAASANGDLLIWNADSGKLQHRVR